MSILESLSSCNLFERKEIITLFRQETIGPLRLFYFGIQNSRVSDLWPTTRVEIHLGSDVWHLECVVYPHEVFFDVFSSEVSRVLSLPVSELPLHIHKTGFFKDLILNRLSGEIIGSVSFKDMKKDFWLFGVPAAGGGEVKIMYGGFPLRGIYGLSLNVLVRISEMIPAYNKAVGMDLRSAKDYKSSHKYPDDLVIEAICCKRLEIGR